MECLKDQFSYGIILDGRYETIAPLNHGSFGMVFLARDVINGEMVAIKCLTKRSVATESCGEFAVDDKSEELGLHRRLGTHANIVNLVGSFETESHMFLVLEYCHRGDLYEAIREGRGPLETEHVRQFMLQLVDAVSYMHSRGVYHRDIKPENIFLTQSGSMKLGDFGLATAENWTMETTVGSDRYMSPEQYDSAGSGYSPAQADIWAIGVCLLNILFSRNPFTSPTESDPLFLDFSRDKQSLFDVFPTLSQDTYEVIVQCMNMDPRRRSLEGAREALTNVVSFTTVEETLDDFCSSLPRTCATANREPLRTPSIQSPHIEQGAFPWAKALQGTPKPAIRQLSVIPDYEEELFPKSEESLDWCSGTVHTPSVSSVLDSSLGGSMQSLAPTRPPLRSSRPMRPQPAMSGSLPIAMAKPKNLSAMSFTFGGRNQGVVSKSWSDLWDEEEEEEEERARHLQTLKDINSRTWSHDSVKTAGVSLEADGGSDKENYVHHVVHNNVDDDLVADGFFFQDVPSSAVPVAAPRYSPPPKRNNFDKWAALGERRRGRGAGLDAEKVIDPGKPRRQNGLGQNHYGGGNTLEHYQHQNNYKTVKERAKECPWNIGRDCNWRREKRVDLGLGDVEWVGAWPEVHSQHA